jgi:hypothetical protein
MERTSLRGCPEEHCRQSRSYPRGWGRAGPDCAIRIDSTLTKGQILETIHLDGIDIALSKESITTLLAEKRREFNELKGRFDAIGFLGLKKKKPHALL